MLCIRILIFFNSVFLKFHNRYSGQIKYRNGPCVSAKMLFKTNAGKNIGLKNVYRPYAVGHLI